MEIIFITREGYKLPGARIRCYNFARELEKYKIKTEILSFSDSLGAKDGEREQEMGLGEKLKFNFMAFRKLAGNRKAILYLQRFNYHSFAPYLAHLFNKNKIIFDLDDWEMRENPLYYWGFPTSKAHYLTRRIAKSSALCIAASRFLERFLLQFNSKVLYIPSVVDAQLFMPSPSVQNNDRIIFSWIGTFHRQEYIDNIAFAMDCFRLLRKKYSHIYFEIVGKGIYRHKLQQLIKQYSDENIIFKRWIEPDDMPRYLSSIDIGIFPVAEETKFNLAKSPTKLFEYMAMAKPTISSRLGEAAHIIKNGENGLLAAGKAEFVEMMGMLIEDAGMRKFLGEKARDTVENNYSLKIIGRQLYDSLRNL